MKNGARDAPQPEKVKETEERAKQTRQCKEKGLGDQEDSQERLKGFPCRHEDICFQLSTVADPRGKAGNLVGMTKCIVQHYQRRKHLLQRCLEKVSHGLKKKFIPRNEYCYYYSLYCILNI